MNSHPFEQFRLSKPILRAVTEEGYEQRTAVQVAAMSKGFLTSSITSCRTIPRANVHRIGRTARAGTVGTALSFCDAGSTDSSIGTFKNPKQSP
jgi:superfamily II DNA/RNA helicase